MKREFLEGLKLEGLTKEIIDQIMTENGKDIEAEKAKTTTKDTELTKANETIEGLQDTVKKFDGVDLEQLKKDLKDQESKYNTDMTNLRREAAVDLAIVQAKGKNAKAIKALLDLDKVKVKDDGTLDGLDLDVLKKSDGYLFDTEAQATLSGAAPAAGTTTTPATKTSDKMTYSEMMAYKAQNPDAQI